MPTRNIKDINLADGIADTIALLGTKVKRAKEAGLRVHLTANGQGQTVTVKVSREYDYDLSVDDELENE